MNRDFKNFFLPEDFLIEDMVCPSERFRERLKNNANAILRKAIEDCPVVYRNGKNCWTNISWSQ